MIRSMTLAIALLFSVSAFAVTPMEKISNVSVKQLLTVGKNSSDLSAKSVISFSAYSGGCTSVEAFSLKIEITKTEQLVTIVRNIPDFCEAVGRLVKLEMVTDKLEISDLDGKQIRIVNPLFVEREFVQ